VDNLPSGEPGQGTKQEQGRLKWSVCSLTGEPLRAPIVMCELGKLYNRTSIIGMFHTKNQSQSHEHIPIHVHIVQYEHIHTCAHMYQHEQARLKWSAFEPIILSTHGARIIGALTTSW
jgi:hypothetical protein